MTRRLLSGALAAMAGLVVLTGCTQTVEGTAAKSGSGDVPRNNDSQRQYPNLLKECEVLTEDILAQTVGADPLDIQSTFVGAVCRWQAANPAGLVDITRFWFEQGDIENERKTAQQLNYQIENRSIAGIQSRSRSTSCSTDSRNSSSGSSGIAMRRAERWNRRAFASGRKSASAPSSSRYALSPSKISCA